LGAQRFPFGYGAAFGAGRQVPVVPPPIKTNFLCLVEGTHEEPDANREQLDFGKRYLDVPRNHQPFIEHSVEDVDPVTEPIEVVVGPAVMNARSAGSSSSGSPSVGGEPRREAGVSGRESTVLLAVDRGTDRRGFRKLIDERALVFTRLPVGAARDLAARANESVGRGDGSLAGRRARQRRTPAVGWSRPDAQRDRCGR